MKQSSKKLLALMTAGMLCAGSLGALPAFAETEGETGDNDTIDKADAIPTNMNICGNLHDEDDVDYYAIELTEPGAIGIDFINENVSAYAYYWNISLLYEDGSKITSWDYYGTNKKYSYTPIGLKAGTYYIKICKSDSHSEKSYTFKANFTASSDTLTYESENNDATDNASLIPVNTKICGNLHNEDDVDYYAVELTEPGAIGIDFINENVNAYAYYWNISLLYGDGSEIVSWDYYGTNKEKLYTPIGLEVGTYYIKISKSNSYSENSYNFKAIFTPSSDKVTYETEKNDSIDLADTLGLNASVVGNTHNADDADYYTFTLDKKSNVSLTFDHENNGFSRKYWTVSILNKNGESLQEMLVSGNVASTSTETLKLEPNTYYIKIEKGTEDNDIIDIPYTLTLNAAENTYTKGDANADGSIDSTDVFEMMYSCAKKAVGRTDDLLEGENFLAADIDENGTLDSTDIFYEMLYIASKGAGVPVDWDSIVK